MAYDVELANRYREALMGQESITEKRMMGGICFFLSDNMIGGSDRTKEGSGRFMFRVGKEREAEALSRPGASIMEQGGRRMGGLVYVEEGACNSVVMRDWIELTLEFVSTLPPKI